MLSKVIVLPCALSVVLLAGCGSLSPNVDRHFGDAANTAKVSQIANPDAGKKATPPQGLDGVAAVEAVGRYQKSFKTPPPTTNVFNIGVGSSGGSSGGGSGSK